MDGDTKYDTLHISLLVSLLIERGGIYWVTLSIHTYRYIHICTINEHSPVQTHRETLLKPITAT